MKNKKNVEKKWKKRINECVNERNKREIWEEKQKRWEVRPPPPLKGR